jgi:hypothetical protein
MNQNTIVTYTIAQPRITVPWWKDLLCSVLGHRWPEWKRVSEHSEERNCKRCKILGVRAPAWTVLP